MNPKWDKPKGTYSQTITIKLLKTSDRGIIEKKLEGEKKKQYIWKNKDKKSYTSHQKQYKWEDNGMTSLKC